MEFIVTSDTVLYEDCNFTSKKITDIKKNTVFSNNYTLGPWVNITIENITGWLYPYSKNGLPIVKTKKDFESNKSANIGSIVTIKPNIDNNIYKDKNGNQFMAVDNRGFKNLFTIVTDKDDNDYFIVKNKQGKEYTVKESDITEVKPKASNNEYYADWFHIDMGAAVKKKDEQWAKSDIKVFPDAPIKEDTQEDTSSPSPQSNANNVNTGTVAETVMKNPVKYAKSLYEAYKNNHMIKTSDNALNRSKIYLTDLKQIFAMPYQYLPIADMRTSPIVEGDTNVSYNVNDINLIGIKYREKILTRMPMLILMPGVVNFMPNYSAEDKNTMLEELFKEESDDFGGLDKFSKEINKSKTRSSYYTFYPAWAQYFKYINTMCRAAAVFMDVGDVTIDGGGTFDNDQTVTALQNYNWQYAGNKALQSSAQGFYKGAVSFYINTENQISENFSNSTTQSQMANKVNGYSDLARELTFIAGSSSMAQDVSGQVTSAVNEVANKLGAKSAARKLGAATMSNMTDAWKTKGFMEAVTDGIKNTIQGAKMIFPELWADSSFSKDYSVEIKLISPDSDPLSVYLNIIVPLLHLIGLAAPRATGPTTYASPFLIRAYYQGFFNVNMGIISSLDITKGDEAQWTYDNVPTEVSVRVGIHDLFATQYISINDEASSGLFDISILNNGPLMEYLANMCGLNYNEPEWSRLMKLSKVLWSHKLTDKPTQLYDAFIQAVNSVMPTLYNDYQTSKLVTIGTAAYTAYQKVTG